MTDRDRSADSRPRNQRWQSRRLTSDEEYDEGVLRTTRCVGVPRTPEYRSRDHSRERGRRSATRRRDDDAAFIGTEGLSGPRIPKSVVSNSKYSMVQASPSDWKRSKSLPPHQSGIKTPRTFQYQPLMEGDIRVMRIIADDFRSKVRCELVHTPLKRPRPYIAISYAWGDAQETMDIQLNDCPFTITRSLHGALKAMRQSDHYVLVWADAVCINQKNNKERSEQVSSMYEIYRRAESVGIWLGPEADDSDLAMSLVEEIAEYGWRPAAMTQIIWSRSWLRHFHALVDLFERDYWSRLWVVQEVGNARLANVYCGRKKIPWSRLQRTSRLLYEHSEELKRRFSMALSRKDTSVDYVLTIRGPPAIDFQGENSLLRALNRSRPKLTANPCDKIYGLLGILPEKVRHAFKPDYETSPRKLYIDVVEYLLQTTGRIDVIGWAIHFPKYPNTLTLPSWVPDWSQPIARAPISADGTSSGGLKINGSKFNASGPLKGNVELIGQGRSKIRLDAITIGTIRDNGIAVGDYFSNDEILMAFIHWWYLYIPSAAADDEAFCRTITIDQVRRWDSRQWVRICYHSIAKYAQLNLPHLKLHKDLEQYRDLDLNITDATAVLDEELFGPITGRSFFITDNGHMGLGSGLLSDGDVVCIPLGCRTPVLLRPDGFDGEYLFIGDAYVDGLMYGEAVAMLRRGQMKMETFTIH